MPLIESVAWQLLELRRRQEALRRAEAARDFQIRVCLDSGASARRIGRVVGLAHPTVARRAAQKGQSDG